MSESDSPQASAEQVKQATSEAVSHGADIRAKVHDLTLAALQQRRFDRHAFRDVVRAVTEGMALGAQSSRTDMRQALSDAFGGLDQAITKSTEAGRTALRELAASGKDFSDHEFKQALANLKKVEDDLLSTMSQVTDAAGEKVRPELGRILDNARTSGTQTGRQVASTMGEFAQRFTAASVDVGIAGMQAAGEFGARFAMLASGVLAGVADALKPPADAQPPGAPYPSSADAPAAQAASPQAAPLQPTSQETAPGPQPG